MTLVTAASTVDDLLDDTDRAAGLGPGAVALVVVSGASLAWRRRYPVTVLAIHLVAIMVYDIARYPELFYPGIFIALYGVGRHVDPAHDLHAHLTVVTTATWAAIGSVLDGEGLWGAGVIVSIVYLVWFLGQRLRRGQEREVQLRRQQSVEAERAVAEERTRIARELHDIVAHRVSMMTVQAGAAKTVVHVDPDEAAEAMAEVEHAGRQALGELRHLLDVLRPRSERRADLGPHPGLADVADLVDQHVDSGMDVELSVDDLPTGLSGPVDLYAYRIVQESLTNVLKHADPTTHAEVRLGTEDGALVIEVTNTGSGGTAVAPAGYGILGMRERAELLGGSLRALPRSEGGFGVWARLPLGLEHR